MDVDSTLPLWPTLSIEFSFGILIGVFILLLLLVLSALISGSEVAYFSIRAKGKDLLEKENNDTNNRALYLLNNTNDLLATILITNNFVNVSIVILSSYLFDYFTAGLSLSSTAKFLIQTILITFIILLLGEIIPKIYATKHNIKLVKLMATPLYKLNNFFLIKIMRKSMQGFMKLFNRNRKLSYKLSSDELEIALELPNEGEIDQDERKILKSIIQFGNIEVKQIMKSRVDVVGFELNTPFEEVIQTILDSGYSRIPVYKESFDNVEGLLYIKDLLKHINEPEFKWQELIRPPFFIPENRKLDDVLQDFQERKVHLAFVVDEYGGISGITTLEDILEEIVGDISDEFDIQEDITYTKIDDKNFVFEAKTPLIDIYRIMDIDGEQFEENKGESDSLGGFIVEMFGRIPKKNETLDFEQYCLKIEAADTRKIKTVKITINEH